MIRHYLVAALRNMAANRLLSALAIVSLTLGITAILAVVSGLREVELWDEFIPGYERTVLVIMPATGDDGPYSRRSDPRIAGLLKLALPEIEATARVTIGGAMFRHGNVTASDEIYWTDPWAFKVLPFPVFRGDLNASLSRPDGLVIERQIARKYFGHDDAVGEVLDVNGHPMIVRAVLDDFPSGTEFGGGIFASNLSAAGAAAPAGGTARRDDSTLTYLRLRPDVSRDAIQQRAHKAIMPVLAERPLHGSGADADAPLLMPIDGSVYSEKLRPGFRKTIAVGMSILALLLFMASVNFVNMMTARSARRATEVSMRKVCGAGRGALILQFLGESIVVVFISTCFALALSEWLRGRINNLGQGVPFDFWDNPQLLGALLLGILLLGVAAGAWPAFALSSFRPVRVLKGISNDVGRAGIIRNGLVTLQFAILTGLTIVSLVMYQQYAFGMSRKTGFEADHMLMIDTACRPLFLDELRRLPGVTGVACTGSEFFSNSNTLAVPFQGRTVTLDLVRVDWSAFPLYGIKPLAGSLPATSPTESSSRATQGIVINRLAARPLGFASPQAAIGKFAAQTGALASVPVVAVVPDFALYSIERPLEATVFVPTTFAQGSDVVNVKLRSENISETLIAIDRIWSATSGAGPTPRQFYDPRSLYNSILERAVLIVICSLVALFLGCLGLTGLAVSAAERRTKEIGVRKAMGAGNREIVGLLLWQFSQPVLWASLIAWPVAWWVMRGWLSGFAYHVSLSWWLFPAVGAATLLIALATVGGHAWLVARQKPVLALRYE